MELSKEELVTIHQALIAGDGPADLIQAVDQEIEKLDLAEMSFDDEDDGCAGGACKL